MIKKTKKIIVLVVVLFAVFVLYSVIRGIIEGEEGKVKRLIFSVKRAIEKEEILKYISYVSLDYTDKYGNDRSRVFFIAKGLFEEYGNISINITELEVEVAGEGAWAEIEAIGYGQRQGVPEEKLIEYDKAKVKVRFRKEEEGWKVIELEFIEPEGMLSLPGIA